MEIGLLCGNGFRVRVHVAFIIFIRETTGLNVPFRVTVSEIGLGGDNNMNVPFLEFGNQIVHQVEMLVFKEISLLVCEFDIPKVDTVSVQSQTGDMIYVFIYSSFTIKSQIT